MALRQSFFYHITPFRLFRRTEGPEVFIWLFLGLHLFVRCVFIVCLLLLCSLRTEFSAFLIVLSSGPGMMLEQGGDLMNLYSHEHGELHSALYAAYGKEEEH